MTIFYWPRQRTTGGLELPALDGGAVVSPGQVDRQLQSVDCLTIHLYNLALKTYWSLWNVDHLLICVVQKLPTSPPGETRGRNSWFRFSWSGVKNLTRKAIEDTQVGYFQWFFCRPPCPTPCRPYFFLFPAAMSATMCTSMWDADRMELRKCDGRMYQGRC